MTPNVTAGPSGAPIRAAVNLEEVVRAYYERLPSDSWAWVREVWVGSDGSYLIVDDGAGTLFRVPFEASGDTVTFGEPSRTRIRFEDVDDDRGEPAAVTVAAARTPTAVRLSVGEVHTFPRPPAQTRPATVFAGADPDDDPGVAPADDPDGNVAAVTAGQPHEPSADNPPPTNDNDDDGVTPEERDDPMDSIELREHLGLPEDATDVEVREAIHAMRAANDTDTPPGDGDDGDVPADGDDAGTDPADPPAADDPQVDADEPQPVAAAGTVNLSAVIGELRRHGLEVIDTETRQRLTRAAEQVETITAEREEADRDNTITAAIRAGRIAPEARQRWLDRWNREVAAAGNADDTRELLTTLPENVVPVAARGHDADPDPAGDIDSQAIALFGEGSEIARNLRAMNGTAR